MKIKSLRLFPIGILALATLMAGCATSSSSKQADKVQQMEALLVGSGFNAVPATTAEQLQQLQSLRAGKLSAVKRNGKQYYVYPDTGQKTLYVGNESQYQAYLSNRSDAQEEAQYDSISKSDPAAAAYNNEVEILQGNQSFDPWERAKWGPWDMSN